MAAPEKRVNFVNCKVLGFEVHCNVTLDLKHYYDITKF